MDRRSLPHRRTRPHVHKPPWNFWGWESIWRACRTKMESVLQSACQGWTGRSNSPATTGRLRSFLCLRFGRCCPRSNASNTTVPGRSPHTRRTSDPPRCHSRRKPIRPPNEDDDGTDKQTTVYTCTCTKRCVRRLTYIHVCTYVSVHTYVHIPADIENAPETAPDTERDTFRERCRNPTRVYMYRACHTHICAQNYILLYV